MKRSEKENESCQRKRERGSRPCGTGRHRTPLCLSAVLFFIPSFLRPNEETIEIITGLKLLFLIMLRFSSAVQREAGDTSYILPSPRLSLPEYSRTQSADLQPQKPRAFVTKIQGSFEYLNNYVKALINLKITSLD